ncbi:helix-turn-helix domain-containing protein [Paenibacillus profundus]|uniref:helix-turn-helix domain-containing protein n=1 Tax=Paenibacillus profundus TaxID=1173085 RepID=UPI002D80DC01|nr:helix-turn-helix domain-containing protein [Paenibacillus profundus]
MCNERKLFSAAEYGAGEQSCIVQLHFFQRSIQGIHRRYFVSYLKKVRIRKAMELLAHSSMRLAEAGNAVGFENTKQQFSRMFKKLEGISPHEYRLKVRVDIQLSDPSIMSDIV